MKGDLDISLVKLNLRGMIVKIVSTCYPLIYFYREKNGRAWEHLIWIYIQFDDDNDRRQRVVAGLGPRPTFLNPTQARYWEKLRKQANPEEGDEA